MPAVVIAGPIATQNSFYYCLAVVASTYYAYSQMDGQAELALVAGYIARWFTGWKDVPFPRVGSIKR